MTLSWAGPSHAHNKNPAPSTIAARREVAILKSGSLDVRELKAAGGSTFAPTRHLPTVTARMLASFASACMKRLCIASLTK